jgi:tetratricopeptide (TPR) repeat protein
MSQEQINQKDPIAFGLQKYAQNVLVIVFGFLPLIFIPSTLAPFDYTKLFVVLVGLFISLVLYSLSVLRSGIIPRGISYPLSALWLVAVVALVSSLLSGDFKDSLIGDQFSIHATVFVIILALIPSVWVLLKSGKDAVLRMYFLFAISTLVLVVFHVLRIIFGADFLAFSVFTNATATPVGSWNDLALFLGLTVIISLVTIEQIALTKVGKILFGIVIFSSLFMLGVINFFVVWYILGLTSLAMIVYALGKDRFSESQLPLLNEGSTKGANMVSLWVSLVVFAVSILFIVGGASLGSAITKMTGVSYIEVRPSFESTANIARSVYGEHAFLGIGTNKFTDAWRIYKDSSINTTAFWNTDFNAGNGYITSFFVTTGVLGGVAWILFLATYCVTGIRRLLDASHGDKKWYYIAVSSFVSAVYVWGMSIIYVPGVVILLIGALCTGVSLQAFSVLSGTEARTISVGINRRTGFLLTFGIVIIVVGSVSVLYIAGRHYSSVYTFNQSVQSMQDGKPVETLEAEVVSAYQLFTSDTYSRRVAEYQLLKLNNLATLQDPTEEQLKQFNDASAIGINAAQLAIQNDPQEPANYAVLGGIYSVLAALNFEGAQEKAIEALTKAQQLNPKNPLPYLELAIVEARSGNFDTSRNFIQQAITLKPNFTEAFFLLSQLEIATGNVDAAIQSAQAVITLDPQNPARYYQLGILENAKENTEAAVAAFEQAVALDTNFANARYLLALGYDLLGRGEDAKAQLEVVLKLNPGNAGVEQLLTVINTEGSLQSLRAQANQTVSEATPVTNENGTVSTDQTDDTPLINPVNTAPEAVTE